jgi:prevent-host-death family protein
MKVSIYEAKARLSELLNLSQEGEEITITRHRVPVARLVGIPSDAIRPTPPNNLQVAKIGDTPKKRGQRGRRLAPRACGPDIWDIQSWCDQLGIGYSTYHTLKVQPKSVKVGQMYRVIESPADYTKRMAARQEVGGEIS